MFYRVCSGRKPSLAEGPLVYFATLCKQLQKYYNSFWYRYWKQKEINQHIWIGTISYSTVLPSTTISTYLHRVWYHQCIQRAWQIETIEDSWKEWWAQKSILWNRNWVDSYSEHQRQVGSLHMCHLWKATCKRCQYGSFSKK